MLCLYICHRLFVNLSAFVLVGSPMVLSSTKAESILRLTTKVQRRKNFSLHLCKCLIFYFLIGDLQHPRKHIQHGNDCQYPFNYRKENS